MCWWIVQSKGKHIKGVLLTLLYIFINRPLISDTVKSMAGTDVLIFRVENFKKQGEPVPLFDFGFTNTVGGHIVGY